MEQIARTSKQIGAAIRRRRRTLNLRQGDVSHERELDADGAAQEPDEPGEEHVGTTCQRRPKRCVVPREFLPELLAQFSCFDHLLAVSQTTGETPLLWRRAALAAPRSRTRRARPASAIRLRTSRFTIPSGVRVGVRTEPH